VVIPLVDDGETPLRRRIPLLVACGILILLIVTAGLFIYQSQEQLARETATGQLISISSLKAEEIARWREDRLYDARTIAASSFFIEGVSEYRSSPDSRIEEMILTRFREINQSRHYHNVILADPEGTILLSLDPEVESISPLTAASVKESLQSGAVVMTDFHSMPVTGRPHLDVVAPLVSSTNGSKVPVGAVILAIDPEDYIYPFIRSWPVPSRTAETLLVERQGDNVLFLNDLKHMEHTALNLTVPLTETDVPAVMAVLGKTGVFEGRDYRGVAVMSDIRPVPGSPWFMVAKVDAEEAFASWAAQSFLILVIGAGILAGVLVATAWIWQREQKLHYQSLYVVEAEKSRVEQLMRERAEALLHIASMETATEQELADFVMDAACRLTGSSLAFIGKMSPDESVFDLMAWSRSVMGECAVSKAPLHFPIAWAGIWADAVRRRQPVTVNDYDAPLPAKKGLPSGHVPIRRFLSVPVFEGHRIVMLCAVANKDTEYVPDDVDQLVLLLQGVWGHLQKRVAAEALQKKHADLEAAYEEITATQEELQANYDELARSQQALQESEERYREFFATSRDSVFITTPEGKWVDFNDASLEMFGYPTRDELMALPVPQLYADPLERDEFLAVIAKEGFVKEHPIRLRRKNGIVIDTLITAVPIRDHNNTIRAFMGTIRDVTFQKAAEKALRESEDMFRHISGLITDFAYSCRKSPGGTFRIDWLTGAVEAITGYTPAEIHALTCWRPLVIEEDIPIFDREVIGLLPGESSRAEIRIRRRDGKVVWLASFAECMIDREDPTFYRLYGGCRDISARKEADQRQKDLISELEQKNAELERFTYTVSHDLKSPLITIRGFAGLLEEDVERGDLTRTREDISRIIAAADKMQQLLADVLELSRIGRIVAPPEETSFGLITKEAVDLLSGPLAERGVRVEIEPDLPVVRVDHPRIREVMANLIENSVKYMGDQPDPVIRIGVDRSGKEPVFFVQDNGIGIDPKYLERIFNIFEKLDPSAPGTGVGLAIVKRIIEVHGGRIWAESEGAGKGTTICFTLPGPGDRAQ